MRECQEKKEPEQSTTTEVSALFERMEGRGQELVGSRSRLRAHHSSATSYGRCGTHAARCESDRSCEEPMLRAPAAWCGTRSPKDRQVSGRGLEVRSAAGARGNE